jgi:hypothetical protein
MTISMYKTSVPIFVQFLTSMSAVLDKAAAHCGGKKIEPAMLLNMRLYPDMFPLVRQLRAVTDHAISPPRQCGSVAPRRSWKSRRHPDGSFLSLRQPCKAQ